MLTLPEHLNSPLVFIEVHVVLSSVSPYFMYLSRLFDFGFWLFLLCDCVVFLYFIKTLRCFVLGIVLTTDGFSWKHYTMAVLVGTLDGLVLWKILLLFVLLKQRLQYHIHCIVMHLNMKLIQVSNRNSFDNTECEIWIIWIFEVK